MQGQAISSCCPWNRSSVEAGIDNCVATRKAVNCCSAIYSLSFRIMHFMCYAMFAAEARPNGDSGGRTPVLSVPRFQLEYHTKRRRSAFPYAEPVVIATTYHEHFTLCLIKYFLLQLKIYKGSECELSPVLRRNNFFPSSFNNAAQWDPAEVDDRKRRNSLPGWSGGRGTCVILEETEINTGRWVRQRKKKNYCPFVPLSGISALCFAQFLPICNTSTN